MRRANGGRKHLGKAVRNRGGVCLVVRVARVTVDDLDLDAEVCLVDLLGCECDTSLFWRAEERESTGLRQQGADLQREVSFFTPGVAVVGFGWRAASQHECCGTDGGDATDDCLARP